MCCVVSIQFLSFFFLFVSLCYFVGQGHLSFLFILFVVVVIVVVIHCQVNDMCRFNDIQ